MHIYRALFCLAAGICSLNLCAYCDEQPSTLPAQRVKLTAQPLVVLQSIAEVAGLNLVSIIPDSGDQSEVIAIDSIAPEAAKVATKKLNATAFIKNKVLIVYRAVPPWFKPSIKRDEPNSEPYIALGDLLSTMSSTQRDLLNQNKEIPLAAFSQESKNRFKKLLKSHIEGLDESYVRDTLLKIDASLKNTSLKLYVHLSGWIYLYENSKAVGIVQLPTRINGEPSFDTPIDIEGAGLPTWDKPPLRIEPLVDLTAVDRNKKISLSHPTSILSISELLKELRTQQVPFIGSDKSIANIRILLSGKDWTVGQIMESVTIAVGCEVRKIAGSYYLGLSPVHTFLVTNQSNVDRSIANHKFITEFFSPLIFGKIFAQKIHPFDMKQFNADPFSDSSMVSWESLSEEQRIYLSGIIKDNIPDVKNNNALQVRFVVDSWTGLIDANGKVQSQLSVGMNLFPYQPELLPTKPKNSKWKVYVPEDILKRFGAIVIPAE